MSKKHAAVDIKDLVVTFSKWGQNVNALDGINLEILKGQWVMVVGHNGSGKSTLLKAISGQERLKQGHVFVDNKSVAEMKSSEIASKIFRVHQDPLLGTAPKLTLFENLMVADYEAQAEGLKRTDLKYKYEILLKPLGLAGRLKQLLCYFSGGERQLISLLITMLRPSSLLLLDEPLAALDPVKSKLCLEVISQLHKKGNTIIQVTHDPDFAVFGGNRSIVLSHGKIIYDKPDKHREFNVIHEAWSS